MAGANYEVNLQLKADPALKALERIEKKINGLTKSSVDLQDARGAAMVKNRNLADKINKLEEKGVDVAKMRERLGKAIEKTDRSKLKTAAAHRGIVKELIKDENKLLDVKQNQLKIDRQQQRQRAGVGAPGRFGQAVLGGGFPLLFGGSPFQALGGAVGGAVGGFAGGIGAQVAIGQIENLFAKAAELGQGLGELNFDLQGVTEAAGFAGTETAQFLERIEQYGDAALAAELATKLLERRIGVEGVQALKDFGEKASELGRALSTIFTQVLAGIAQAAGPLISFLAKFAGEQAAVGGFKERTDLIVGSREEFAQQVLTGDIGGTGRGGKRARLLARAKELGIDATTERQVREFARQTAIASQEQFEMPVIQEIEFQAGLVQDPAQKSAASKAQRQQLKDFLELNKQMTAELDRQDEINEMNGKHIAEQLNTADKINASQEKRAGMLEAQLNGTEKEFKLDQAIKEIKEKGLLPADEERLIQAEKQIHAMGEQVNIFKEQERLVTQIGETVKSGLVDGIMAALDGTKSLSESLAGVLRQLASMFMQVGISSIGQGLKIPGFANGGSPPVGRPSIVGERGPELFVPKSAGTIVPNHALGGANVVVNVDASGTQAQGNQPNAKALGAAIGAAVQAELVKQKRPGGLLS